MLIYSAHYQPNSGERVGEVMFKVDNDITRLDLWIAAARTIKTKEKSMTGALRVTFVCNPDACLVPEVNPTNAKG